MLKTKRIIKKMLFSILQLFQTLPMEMALHIYIYKYIHIMNHSNLFNLCFFKAHTNVLLLFFHVSIH